MGCCSLELAHGDIALKIGQSMFKTNDGHTSRKNDLYMCTFSHEVFQGIGENLPNQREYIPSSRQNGTHFEIGLCLKSIIQVAAFGEEAKLRQFASCVHLVVTINLPDEKTYASELRTCWWRKSSKVKSMSRSHRDLPKVLTDEPNGRHTVSTKILPNASIEDKQRRS